MRVIIPYVGKIDDRVWDAVTSAEANPTGVGVHNGVDAYWKLLSALWSAGETFIIVEHDIVVTREAWEELTNCNAEWCTQPYAYMTSTHAGLGCVLFDGALLRRHPDIMEEVAKADYPKHGPKHWCTLDQALTNALRARGEAMHRHQHYVEHLGDNWPSHGCLVKP